MNDTIHGSTGCSALGGGENPLLVGATLRLRTLHPRNRAGTDFFVTRLSDQGFWLRRADEVAPELLWPWADLPLFEQVCDCLNSCGDDPWLKDGRAPYCEDHHQRVAKERALVSSHMEKDLCAARYVALRDAGRVTDKEADALLASRHGAQDA